MLLILYIYINCHRFYTRSKILQLSSYGGTILEIKKMSVDNRTNKIENENIGKQRTSSEKEKWF